MDTHSPTNMNVTYIERLQQAVRVMQGLPDTERENFNISLVAVRCERGISGCIAGLCGLDPWFQARGFTTMVSEDIDRSTGDVSLPIDEFFGTEEPFFCSHYPPELRGDRLIEVDHAIAALRKAIASFESMSTESPANPAAS